jgi:hypothetical protein
MKITKNQLQKMIKEELNEAIAFQSDFKVGMTVYWDALVSTERTVPSTKPGGKDRIKLDIERVTVTGVIDTPRPGERNPMLSTRGDGGIAIMRDPSGATHEVDISELRTTPEHLSL